MITHITDIRFISVAAIIVIIAVASPTDINESLNHCDDCRRRDSDSHHVITVADITTGTRVKDIIVMTESTGCQDGRRILAAVPLIVGVTVVVAAVTVITVAAIATVTSHRQLHGNCN
jgi:hypothetical protein